MADASAAISTPRKITPFDMFHEFPQKASSVVYQGIGIGIAADGTLCPASTAGNVATAGIATKTNIAPVTGDMCKVMQGIFRLANAGSGTVVLASGHRWQRCYWADDQTVTMTPGTLEAGIVYDVDSQGVWVALGLDVPPSEIASASDAILNIFMSDLVGADARVFSAFAPIAGTITKLQTLLNAALTTGNAVATVAINGVNITTGAVTMVQAASAAGQVNLATPTAANVVAKGDKISVTISGTQASTTATAALAVTIAGA